jgi:CRISPR/Cas system CMR subunit Cmr4 (Cas7 group RAMP superfamily)
MSVTTPIVRSRLERLIRAVARLTPKELSEFVLRFDDFQLARLSLPDAQAARIADAHRLPADDRARVADLLTKNREEGLSAQEEAELDAYMNEMDRRLNQVTDDFLALARQRPTARRSRT